MNEDLSHEVIARKFAEVFDFRAMGELIAELGPELAVSDKGWHGFNIGRYSILACMLPAADVTRVVGDLRAATLAAQAMDGALEAGQ